MQKFTKLTGVAAPLPMHQCRHRHDHPQAVPEDDQAHRARQGLFSEMRYDEDGKRDPGFRAQQAGLPQGARSWSPARISAAARRASTRLGRCSISASAASSRPSFADIFYNNCFKNGILPIKLPQAEVDKLIDDAERGANATLTVDLETQEIRGPDGGMIKFDIDPFRKHCLMNGLDDIGLTLEKEKSIKAFEETAHAARPWA